MADAKAAKTKSTKKTSGGKVIRCTCKHDFQDRTFGESMRFMNQTTKGDGKTYRCTVCAKEVSG